MGQRREGTESKILRQRRYHNQDAEVSKWPGTGWKWKIYKGDGMNEKDVLIQVIADMIPAETKEEQAGSARR